MVNEKVLDRIVLHLEDHGVILQTLLQRSLINKEAMH